MGASGHYDIWSADRGHCCRDSYIMRLLQEDCIYWYRYFYVHTGTVLVGVYGRGFSHSGSWYTLSAKAEDLSAGLRIDCGLM